MKTEKVLFEAIILSALTQRSFGEDEQPYNLIAKSLEELTNTTDIANPNSVVLVENIGVYKYHPELRLPELYPVSLKPIDGKGGWLLVSLDSSILNKDVLSDDYDFLQVLYKFEKYRHKLIALLKEILDDT